MIDVCEKLNKLIEKVQNSDKEGIDLKIFIAENIMESLKILFKYFGMYIKKNSKKIKNGQKIIKRKNQAQSNVSLSPLTVGKLEKLLNGNI